MENFSKRHDELFFDVLKAFDSVKPISFGYKDNGIYDLPRVSIVEGKNILNVYAITKFNNDSLTIVSLDDHNYTKEIERYNLDLVECIELYEYINEYIIQSN